MGAPARRCAARPGHGRCPGCTPRLRESKQRDVRVAPRAFSQGGRRDGRPASPVVVSTEGRLAERVPAVRPPPVAAGTSEVARRVRRHRRAFRPPRRHCRRPLRPDPSHAGRHNDARERASLSPPQGENVLDPLGAPKGRARHHRLRRLASTRTGARS